MEKYLKESEDVLIDTGFGESYDREWAIKDQSRREGIEEGMEKGIEKGRKEGMQRGIKKGMEKGIEKGIKETALKMLKKKININLIAECTNLTTSQIQSLM